MSFPSLVFTTNYSTESNVSPGECHQQHYLVVGCHALLQLHVQITYTESGSLEQLLNLCLGFFFPKSDCLTSPLNCSGFTSQEAQEVAWAGRCDCIPVCVDLNAFVCVHSCTCVYFRTNPTNMCHKPPERLLSCRCQSYTLRSRLGIF